MNFNIRKAAIEDAHAMAIVHVESWRTTYRGQIHPDFIAGRTIEKSERMFLSMNCENTIVIETMGQIVGFCGYGKCRDDDMPMDTGEIWGMYMLASYHGRGWGAHLMDVALMELRLLGYKKATLWVLSTNLRAIDFYQRHGFVKDGLIKEVVFITPVKEIRMIRPM